MTIISLILSSTAFSVITKRKLTDCLLPISCLFMLCGYFLAIFANLGYWKYLSVLFMVIACAVLWKKKYAIVDTLSIGLGLFGIVYFIIFVLCRRILVTSWDDFNHWAVVTKQIYFLGKIPTGKISISGFSDYPPIVAVWFNIFLKSFGTYREDIIFGLWNFLLGMCTLPFWEMVDRKNRWYKNCLLFYLSILLPFAMAYTSFYTLQVDWLVSFMTLYVLCRIIKDKSNSSISIILLGLVLSALSLVKAVAIVMVLECLLILAIVLLTEKQDIRISKNTLVTFAIAVVGIVISYGSWRVFCILGENTSIINSEFNKKGASEYLYSFLWLFRTIPWWVAISLLVSLVVCILLSVGFETKLYLFIIELVNCAIVFLMCESDWYNWKGLECASDSARYIGTNYWHAFCQWGVNSDIASNSFSGLSVLECISISILLMTLFNHIGMMRRRFSIILGTLGVFFVIFCVSHISMYLFLFVGGERDALSAFNRYLSLVVFPIVGIIGYVSVHNCKEDVWDLKEGLLFFVVLVFMVNYRYELVSFGILKDTNSYISKDYYSRITVEKTTDEIANAVKVSDDKSYCLVLGGESSFYDHYMRYLLMPARLSGIISSDSSMDEIVEKITSQYYDYVFIYMPELNRNINIDLLTTSTDYDEVGVTDSGFMILQHNYFY